MRKVLLMIFGAIIVVSLGLGIYYYVWPKLTQENRQIDTWIKDNNLNSYGDAQNTVYSNGKPCNTNLACYDYIKKMHSDKPWEK